jgi:hypothetical protein
MDPAAWKMLPMRRYDAHSWFASFRNATPTLDDSLLVNSHGALLLKGAKRVSTLCSHLVPAETVQNGKGAILRYDANSWLKHRLD